MLIIQSSHGLTHEDHEKARFLSKTQLNVISVTNITYYVLVVQLLLPMTNNSLSHYYKMLISDET